MPSGKLEARSFTFNETTYQAHLLPNETVTDVFSITNPFESCLPDAMRKMLQEKGYDTFGVTDNGRQVGLTIVEEG